MQQNEITPNDYLQIIKRRKWSIILTSLIVFLTAAIIAFALSSIYISTSTILIEEQEIPQAFVMATVTSYAEQRLQSINQRIMSTSRLLEIINRFNLYEDIRKKWATEEIIEKMREDIKLETISAEVLDRRTGRPSVATIAFTLSYEGKDPKQVQQVSNMLASLYLEENLKVRKRQTKEAYTFLEEELKKVKSDLLEIEKKLAEFKEKNINELPELLQVNLQALSIIERNIERDQEQLRTLRERRSYLKTQLASIPESENQDKMRLNELRVQLTHFKTLFSDEHPDVIKTGAEIAQLEKQIAESSDTPSNPGSAPDNPAYITLSSQLSSIISDIKSVKRQIKDLQKKESEYHQRIGATPKVEQNYNAIIIKRSNIQVKYNDLMRKSMEAKVAHGLEKEQKGERFTLIDPARLPEKPYKPNRLAIILIGFVLSIGAGIAVASVSELFDDSVHKADTLVLNTGFPVLAAIPEIVTPKDIAKKRFKRRILAVSLLLIIAAGLVIFHFFIMDFNVFWAKAMRWMSI